MAACSDGFALCGAAAAAAVAALANRVPMRRAELYGPCPAAGVPVRRAELSGDLRV
jgi:hypothetical protein